MAALSEDWLTSKTTHLFVSGPARVRLNLMKDFKRLHNSRHQLNSQMKKGWPMTRHTMRFLVAFTLNIALLTMSSGQASAFPDDVPRQPGRFSEAGQDPTRHPEWRNPTAAAGPDQHVWTGQVVQLDGSASRTPNNVPLTYQWSLQRPTGSSASLAAPTSVAPTFTPDIAGLYQVKLTVKDSRASRSDTVNITVKKATSFTSTKVTYVKAADTNLQKQSHFGNAVALSGNTMAVGVYGEKGCGRSIVNGAQASQAPTNCSNSGAVYIYIRDTDGVWTQQAYLKADNADAEDEFGTSIAIDGDTLAVAAPGERSCGYTHPPTGTANPANNGCEGAGAVYIFTRAGTTWTQTAYLKDLTYGINGTAYTGQRFGHSVSLSGDTLAVGAYMDSGCKDRSFQGKCVGAGSAFVFTRSHGVWPKQGEYLEAPDVRVNGYFGSSIAIDGNTLAAGAYGDPLSVPCPPQGPCAYAGAVYIFTRRGGSSRGTWDTQPAILKGATANDKFGHTIALSGNTLAVTASGDDSCAQGISMTKTGASGCTLAGAVHVFARTPVGGWSQQAYVKASNTGGGDHFGGYGDGNLFGGSLAIIGDRLAAGAWEEDSCAKGINGGKQAEDDNQCGRAGAVYGFIRSSGMWSQNAYVKSSNTGVDHGFGIAVALTGDTLAVGAFREDSCAKGVNGVPTMSNPACEWTGAVYIFNP